MESIFFVTLFYYNKNIENHFDCSTLGIYPSIEDAMYAVENNVVDIAEGGTNKHALIEQLENFGCYPCLKEICWYELVDKETYRMCEKPERFKNVVNFAMG